MQKKTRRRKKDKVLDVLGQISSAITGDFYLDDILKLIVSAVAGVLSSPISSLMLLDKDGNLKIKSTQSVSRLYNEKPPLKIGEGIAGKVVKNNKPIVVYDISREEEYKYKDIARKEGLASLICVPLSVKGKAIGVLNCYTSSPHKFTRKEIAFITTIANQAALVIQNTQLLVESKIIQEELETRKRIERAKGILMKEKNISEEEAYRLIQRYSMDKRKSMKEVSEAIITAYQIENL